MYIYDIEIDWSTRRMSRMTFASEKSHTTVRSRSILSTAENCAHIEVRCRGCGRIDEKKHMTYANIAGLFLILYAYIYPYIYVVQ